MTGVVLGVVDGFGLCFTAGGDFRSGIAPFAPAAVIATVDVPWTLVVGAS
jgi:hypothetical protein